MESLLARKTEENKNKTKPKTFNCQKGHASWHSKLNLNVTLFTKGFFHIIFFIDWQRVSKVTILFCSNAQTKGTLSWKQWVYKLEIHLFKTKTRIAFQVFFSCFPSFIILKLFCASETKVVPHFPLKTSVLTSGSCSLPYTDLQSLVSFTDSDFV